MMLSGSARLAGVLGWPVAHTVSPRLHGYWLEKYGIDGVYLPLPVHPDDFALAVRGLVACGFRGANVTLPHKQAAFAVCDHVEPSARAAGAVNTLVFEAGGIVGSNTDGRGFLASLAEQGVVVGEGPVLVLGAGGAARGIAAALLGVGARVVVTSRREAAAAALAACLPGVRTAPWPGSSCLAGSVLLVNATAGGMAGRPPLAVDLAAAPAGLVVADIVIAPRETALLAEARARGLVTVEGLGMLLHQAVPGFAAWFGATPVVDAALRAFVAG